MKPKLPAPDQIQRWIDAVQPHSYFDALADFPGMLVLRAKKPPCDYRGLHLALSDEGRRLLADGLIRMAGGRENRAVHRAGYPSGRSWFLLFTSGVLFAAWNTLEMAVAPSLPPDAIFVRYRSALAAVLRISRAAGQSLAAWLRTDERLGRPAPFRLIREERPDSPPRRLWVWRWEPSAARPPDDADFD